MLQPHNGIFICTWYDDPQDTALFGLTPLLDELIHTRVKVPDILDKYRDQIPSWAGFDRYAQLEYNDFDPIGDCEDDMGPPPQQMQAPSSPQQRTSGGGGMPAPAFSSVSGPYQSAPPQGVESAGGFRSEAPSPMAGVRQEASPPSSPPIGGSMGFTTQHAMQSQPQHGTQPLMQQTYLAPEQQPTMSMTPMGVSTGPAVSSSYDAYGRPLQQRPPQPVQQLQGYPQMPQAGPQPHPQTRQPAVRQQAQQQFPGQVGPQRALAPAGPPGQAQAPGQQQALGPQRGLIMAQQPQRQAAAPALSYQSPLQAPQQAAHPQAQPAFFARPGVGPHQAPAPALRRR